MLCKICGSELRNNERFCGKCGAEIFAAPTKPATKSQKRYTIRICVLAAVIAAVAAAMIVGGSMLRKAVERTGAEKNRSVQNEDISASGDYSSSDIINELNNMLEEHENEQ